MHFRPIALAALLLLAACSSLPANLPPIADSDPTVYHLGPGDQVRIITFGDQDLSGQFRLDAAGTITVPLLGDLHANGLTARDLRDEIAQGLIRLHLFGKPSVSVEIISYRPVFVLGEVTHPGQYPYQPGMTVLSAVAVAGGFTYRALEDGFSIVRSTNGHDTEGAAKRQTGVQPGDVVTIYERHF